MAEKCWSCGEAVTDGANCPKCGADQLSQTRSIDLTSIRATPTPTPNYVPGQTDGTALTTAEDDAVTALPPDRALLIVKRGPQAGSRFLLDSDQTTVGRSAASDIFLDDVSVSRKHAVFVRRAGVATGVNFVVTDVGSLNGTYVNRARIESVELVAGDEVQIGKFRLVFYPGVVR